MTVVAVVVGVGEIGEDVESVLHPTVMVGTVCLHSAGRKCTKVGFSD